MNRISSTFARLRVRNEKALIGFLTCGYPSLDTTLDTLTKMVEGGCDIIELGVPFSDPIADGPIIQQASYQALCNGSSLSTTLEVAGEFRRRYREFPLLLMGYTNPFYKRGIQVLGRELESIGIDGLIIPDLPLEASAEWRALLQSRGIDLIGFISATTDLQRVRNLADSATGFIYCISMTGTTGIPLVKLPESLIKNIECLRSYTNVPIALGFGISNQHSARIHGGMFDGVIVGSAIMKLVAESASKNSNEAVFKFVSEMKSGLRSFS